MQVQIAQNGKVLRTIQHEGTTFVESPTSGKYAIRVRNTSHKRRMVVISVDGINVVNGEDAGLDGPGYVLCSHQTADIPGFRRDDGSVAAFEFKEQGESYANQTGRGTSNVGVIGVAVFDEKVMVKVPDPPIIIREEHHHHHHQGYPWTQPYWYGTIGSNSGGSSDSLSFDDSVKSTYTTGGDDMGVQCNTVSKPQPRHLYSLRGIRDVGTAYGEEVSFHTGTTEFERASETPSTVITLRYATKERLKSWGVPVDEAALSPHDADPFPVSKGPSVPPPPGWEG